MKRPLIGDGLIQTGFGELKIFSGSAHPNLTKEIADFLGVPVGQARLRRFPDSEVSFQIDENIRGADVFIIQPTSMPVDQHLMELLVMIDAFRRSSAARITAVVPYYGYARQDRKDKPRVPISAKLVANLLSAAGTNRVLTMDLHKAQIQGFFDIPVDHLFAAPVIIEYLARLHYPKLTIVSPDAGGAERARAYAKRLDAELAVVDKRRTEDGTAEVMNVIGDVEVCRARRVVGSRNRANRERAGGPAHRDQYRAAALRSAAVQEDRRALGRAAPRPGHSEHSRGNVGLIAVCLTRQNDRTSHGSDIGSSHPRRQGEERGQSTARLGKDPRCRVRRAEGWADAAGGVGGGRPESAPANPAFRLGREHAHQPEGRRQRVARDDQGVPAGPGQPCAAARGFLSACHGQGDHRHGADPGEG